MIMTSPSPTRDPRSSEHRRTAGVVAVVLLLLVAAGLVAVWRIHVDGRFGPMVEQTRAVATFSSIDLAGANDVVVHVGGPRHVVVSGRADAVDLVTTDVRLGTLVIGQRPGDIVDARMSVDVTVPSLDSAAISGSGRLTVVGAQASVFSAALSGSGELSVTGTADRYSAVLSGVGSLELGGLVGNQVTVDLSGSGQVTVDATRAVDVNLSGTGSVVYRGNPAHVTRVVTGTGSVTAA